MPNIYIVILNYNGWKDTIECLESIYKLEYDNYKIIVVDNNSSDHSIVRIIEWAEGKLPICPDKSNELFFHSYPNVSKPLQYTFYTKKESEESENNKDDTKLVIIQSGENKGFSAGNNVGIRYAVKKDDYDYIWLLNNDTVIDKNSLLGFSELFKYLTINKIGIIGGKIRYYHRPDKLQSVGVTFNRFFFWGRSIGNNQKDNGQFDKGLFNYDYFMGASMFLSKDLIKTIGLLNENYFLFFEEIDIFIRAKKNGFLSLFNAKIQIYHKDGGSTHKKADVRSNIYFHYSMSKLLFVKTYFPLSILGAYFGIIIQSLVSAFKLNFKPMVGSIRGIYAFLLKKK